MDDFNFYNSENDGYRGGFGDYVDPAPASQPQYSAPQPEGPGKKKRRAAPQPVSIAMEVDREAEPADKGENP